MYEELLKASVQENDAKKIINYLEAANTDPKFSKMNSANDLLDLALKYHGVGLTLDGTNVAVSGPKRAFITWIGYKTKVQKTYPEAEFDVQVVKKSDEFSFEKNSGEVTYHHKITKPFEDEEIIGAYAFVKTNNGQNIEFLDRKTFEKMKSSAMLKNTWDKWESEFWVKSVVKRVCKRRFHDVVKEIEELDNEDYDLRQGSSNAGVKVTRTPAQNDDVKTAIEFLKQAEDMTDLQKRWPMLERSVQQNETVIAAKDEMKTKFSGETK